MFDAELMGKIITGLITAIVTLVVCLINNYFQSKRENANRDEKHQEQLMSLQKTYTDEIGSIKDDYSDQIKGLMHNIGDIKTSVDTLNTNLTHSIDLVKKDIEVLSQKQDAYNNLQARTQALETTSKINSANIENISHRVDRVEGKLP